MERLILGTLAYFKANLLTEQRVHDIVLVAMEQNWEAISAHKDVMRAVVELILRDGIDAGEFEPVDPRETSVLINRSMVYFMHPVLVAQHVNEDLEGQARESVRFLLRAITPRQ